MGPGAGGLFSLEPAPLLRSSATCGSYLTLGAPASSARRTGRICTLVTDLKISSLLQASIIILPFPVTH